MSDQPSNPPLTPTLVGSNWVLPSLDDLSNARVQLHVSIGVSRDDELMGSDLGVRLTADSQDLAQLVGPDPSSSLATIESHGVTAFAQYVFDNPDNLMPNNVSVTLRNQTADFPLESPSPGQV